MEIIKNPVFKQSTIHIMKKITFITAVFLALTFSGCFGGAQPPAVHINDPAATGATPAFDSATQTIYLQVALCDNKYQGIVPVPEKIGNGQEPGANLYWGAAFGIKTFFSKSKNWELISTRAPNDTILERLIFRHKQHKDVYLVADAYNGKYIKQCTVDFLHNSAGSIKDTVMIADKALGIKGHATTLAYVGHDGLMDFQLSETFRNTDKIKRDIFVLACFSKRCFAPYVKDANVEPILWTSHLMAPEAYIIHDALEAYLNNATREQVRDQAAAAYAQYQKCSLKAAKNLLVTGW